MNANELFDMSGKTVILTGASSGLGHRFARTLSRAGASIVLAARREEKIRSLESELPKTIAVTCDISVDADCSRLVETAIKKFGTVDVLVNNAGISDPKRVEAETVDDFRRVLDVNLVAPYTLSRLAGISMVESQRGGVIVNIASIFGLVGSGRMPQASYAASKGAMVNLTRELAAQWARKGVRVNAIAPSFFPTEMTQGLMDNERGLEWVAKMTPMGRGGREHELDGALLFLASEASSYVTGITLPVDGGWTAV